VAGRKSMEIQSDFRNIRRGFTNSDAATMRFKASRSGLGSAYTEPTQRHIVKTE
jgi:hypothetical protein